MTAAESTLLDAAIYTRSFWDRVKVAMGLYSWTNMVYRFAVARERTRMLSPFLRMIRIRRMRIFSEARRLESSGARMYRFKIP